MHTGIDTLGDTANWQQLFDLLPDDKACPYLAPGYYQAYQRVEDQSAHCFWAYKDENNFLFYPFLLKGINSLGYELDSEYVDISGAYGYNGPAGVVRDKEFLEKYNEELLVYLRHNKVVTEFIRYCPVTGNKGLHTYPQQIDVLDNVYVDLSCGLDQVWRDSFTYGVRKAVRRAENYGLRTSVKTGSKVTETDILSFVSIYTSTMRRNAADKYYFFSNEFFKELFQQLDEKVVLAVTWLDDMAISAEVILRSGQNAFGFLGGTLGDHYQYKANTFQRWEIIKFLAGSGIHKYSMGGGATRGDNIYDFKMSFARGCVNPFYIGTKVHLPNTYDDIITQWRIKDPLAAEENSAKIQGYRILQ